MENCPEKKLRQVNEAWIKNHQIDSMAKGSIYKNVLGWLETLMKVH